MSLTFKERLTIALHRGEFAHAYAMLVVHNQIDDFARITTKPDFDIALMWDEKLVEQHVEYQRNRR